jgi:AmiR/NasT family two-component response regulator
MIPTVRPAPLPVEHDTTEDLGLRPTALPHAVPVGKLLALVGAVEPDVVLGLRANGFQPVAVHEPPLPERTLAVFAAGQHDDALRHLVSFGVPVIADGAPEDLDHATKMVALGVADVVSRPVRPEQLATKLDRAIKKFARRR